MNKKLVALAVAGLLAAPLAQAQTANVTLYGRLNIDAEVVNGKQANGQNPNVYRVNTNSSRFGIRGTESLGGGLNAIFQIENSVNPTNSGGTIAGRETFVGLQGGWGTFKVGRFLAPYDDIHPIFGNVPTLTTSILSTATLWAQGAYNATSGGFDDRVQQSIRYDSPVMAGFNFSGQVGAYPSLPNAPHGTVYSVGGFYNNGPFQAGMAYESHVSTRIPGRMDQAFSIAGAWNFGIVRLAGVWESKKYEQLVGDLKNDVWGVSLTGNLGPGQGYLGYIAVNDGKGSAAAGTRVGNAGIGNDTGAAQWVVSYTYPLSKRTLTYAGYVKIVNQTNANYTFNINPYAVANGGDPGGLVAGMVHFF
jgi:predicted porin